MQNKYTLTRWRWMRGCLFLCCAVWAVPLLGCERAVQTCQQDADCKAGERCAEQKCIASSDGSVEKDTEAVPEGSEQNTQPEPPPWPDQVWPEPSVERPDRLIPPEGSTPKEGQRKIGQSCDPARTALSQDRCEKDGVCVFDLRPSVGVCRKACEPNAPSCQADQACEVVLDAETNQPTRHACQPTVEANEPCRHGLACPKDHLCARLSEVSTGVCLRRCAAAADCAASGKQGWCGTVAPLSDPAQSVNACVIQSDGAGAPCSGPRLCGTGLRCIGDNLNKRCRKGCDGGTPCATDETCVPFRNSRGEVLYSLCLPEVQENLPCDATVRCAQGLSCVSLPNKAQVCLKDCKADEKVCNAQTESCYVWATDRKACFRKEVPTGGSCDGGALCAKGLSCLGETPVGPFFCLAPCQQESDCLVGQACLPFGSQGQRFCSASCANGPCPTPLQCDADRCQPVPTQLGERPQNEVCTPSPLAPAKERCQRGLHCIVTGDQGRCFRPCNPQAPAPCPGPIACVWFAEAAAYVCGGTDANTCDLSKSSFCSADSRCVRKLFVESGRCVSSPKQPQDGLCLDETLPCEPAFRCAGDPLTPYRWRCRADCDKATGASCTSGQKCLDLGQGQACFAPCSNGACSPNSLTCEEVQGQSVCL